MKEEKPYTVAIYGGRYADPQERLAMLQKQLNDLLLLYTRTTRMCPGQGRDESLQEQLKRQEKGVPSSDAGTGSAEVSTVNPLYSRAGMNCARPSLNFCLLRKREYLGALSERKRGTQNNADREKKALTDLK